MTAWQDERWKVAISQIDKILGNLTSILQKQKILRPPAQVRSRRTGDKLLLMIKVDHSLAGVEFTSWWEMENEADIKKKLKAALKKAKITVSDIEHIVKESSDEASMFHVTAKMPKPTKKDVSVQDVADFLSGLSWRGPGGGRARRVDVEGKDLISLEPIHRERLDHYGNDGEGWDDEGWERNYAGPLSTVISSALEKAFGKNWFYVEVGEKGHVDIQLRR